MTAASAMTTASMSRHHELTSKNGLPGYRTARWTASPVAPSEAPIAAAQRQPSMAAAATRDHPAASTIAVSDSRCGKPVIPDATALVSDSR